MEIHQEIADKIIGQLKEGKNVIIASDIDGTVYPQESLKDYCDILHQLTTNFKKWDKITLERINNAESCLLIFFISGRGGEYGEFVATSLELNKLNINNYYLKKNLPLMFLEYGGLELNFVENTPFLRRKISKEKIKLLREIENFLVEKGYNLESKVTMLTVRSDPKDIDKIYLKLIDYLKSNDIPFYDLKYGKKYKDNPIFETTHSATGIDVYLYGLGKGYCVDRVLKILGRKNTLIVGIGDSDGDKALFEKANIPICVNNAKEYVKQKVLEKKGFVLSHEHIVGWNKLFNEIIKRY